MLHHDRTMERIKKKNMCVVTRVSHCLSSWLLPCHLSYFKCGATKIRYSRKSRQECKLQGYFGLLDWRMTKISGTS